MRCGGRPRLGETVTDADEESSLDPDEGEIPPEETAPDVEEGEIPPEETVPDLDEGESPPEETAPDLDPDEIQLKEKRPWLEDARSALLSGLSHVQRHGRVALHHIRRYLRVGLRYGRLYGRLGLRYGLRWGGPVLLWGATLSMSFFVLVRGSLYAYQSLGWGTWSSIGLGIFGTTLVFCAYLAWLWTRITGEGRVRQFAPRALIAVVAGYSMFGLLYRSAGDPRDPELRDYYASLHPVMRLGASTYFLFDRNGVVTDLERTAEDYLRMGLPMDETSLHFKLGDRYVHAMDLRTLGRSARRNRLTATYFRFMGFRSLHQVAAADHLHVSLPPR